MQAPVLPIVPRTPPPGIDLDAANTSLVAAGVNPWLAHSLALRGVADPNVALGHYKPLHYRDLKGLSEMVARLVAAIRLSDPIMVVADYDCDGATACAAAVRGLRAMGAQVDFIVPNRFVHGYGLTPGVVDLAVTRTPRPRIIVTVDNGIASVAGVAHANYLGLDVLVTDHHLPGDRLPAAAAIVNPNQPGCPFPSKNLAGCGVMFYVLNALRDALRAAGMPGGNADLSPVLDLIGLGTVADVVKLDANNRWLVNAGLSRIRTGAAHPGVQALFAVSRRQADYATSSDFGFSLGPRINAAGRLADMSTGIRCLISDDVALSVALAKDLANLNDERKKIEGGMREDALAAIDTSGQNGRLTRVSFGEDFHEGVVGIVASRIRERDNAPAVVFAPSRHDPSLLKGSARSVPGLHLRDALDRVHKLGMSQEFPDGLLDKFGGHAMAAGLTLQRPRLPLFRELFERAVSEALGGVLPERSIQVDGDLPVNAIEPCTAAALASKVWGSGFEEPLWHGDFDLVDARLVGADKNHLKMRLARAGKFFDAMQFFCEELPPPGPVSLVYRLGWSIFRGCERAEIVVVDRR